MAAGIIGSTDPARAPDGQAVRRRCAQRRSARHWLLVGPFSALIRRRMPVELRQAATTVPAAVGRAE